MTDFHADELIRRLERLGNLKPAPEATRVALERARRALVENSVAAAPARGTILLKRVAAAAAVLLAIGSLFAWLWPWPSSARAAFAEVQAVMKAPRSLTCRQTTRIGGKPDESIRLLILGNGLCRVEEANGSFTVMDTAKHQALLVDPQKREATLLKGINTPSLNLYELIKNLPSDTSARSLLGKKIDGKDVLGFAVKVVWCDSACQGQDLTLWADVKTRLPVRIEAKGKDDDGKPGEVVIDDFVFDRELDAKLFSFEPPAGYRLVTQGIAELPAAPSDPQLKDLVVTPLVGIGPVQFGMSREEVEKVLGKPDAVQAVGTNGYVDMNYGSRGFFIGASKTLGVVTISCVAQQAMATQVRNFSGKTDKGIALGTTMADIIRAYGEPDSKETNKGSTYLSYHQLQAHFTLFSDKLVQFTVNRPRPAK